MAHMYHFKAKNEGSYALHKATEDYYNKILELLDYMIEVYQGQYEIIENYEIIDSTTMAQNATQYFIEVAEYIKNTRKIAFIVEDTHLQNIIDEMVSLVYQTLYKIKNLK